MPCQVLQDSAEASAGLLSTCTLMGCFCSPSTFVPVLCAMLDEADISLAVQQARLQALDALLLGSGEACSVVRCIVRMWTEG